MKDQPPEYVNPQHITNVPRSGFAQIQRVKARSNKHHAMYWAMLTNVLDAIGNDQYPTPEHLHNAIKLALGYVTTVKSLTGEVLFIPDSTAFASMSQDQFNVFFERARNAIAAQLLDGVDPLAETEMEVA